MLRSHAFRSLLLLSLAAGATTLVWHHPGRRESSLGEARDPDRPAPTEHWLDDEAEERNHSAREAWIEEMHRAAPGVDWRAVERDNGLREMERRRSPGIRSNGAAWTEVGSRNQAGRMMGGVLGPDVGGGHWWYAGSALGGLWRAHPDGSGWMPISDDLYGGVTDVVVVEPFATSDEVLLVRAGSGLPYLSFDLGASWSVPAGLSEVTNVRNLARLDSGASQSLLVYATANIAGVGTRSALYVSSDRGVSFQRRYTFDASWPGSMWATRPGAAGQDIFVAHKGRCFRSTDLGFTFNETAVIDTGASTVNLTATEAGNPRVYAAAQVSGVWKLYRSGTAGANFQYVRDLSDYWGPLQASITDPDLLLYGGVECWRSTDRGDNFTKINGWGDYYGDPANKLHADLMRISVQLDPRDDTTELWSICTDGGIYASTDGAASVHNLGLVGLGVGQYYSTHTSSRDPHRIQVGAQDQGYQIGVVQTPRADGPSTDFAQIISGDYGHLTSTDGTNDLVFSTYPGFVLVAEGEESTALHSTGFPAGASNLWLPPVVAHPTILGSFFFLGDKLWRGDRSGNSWNYTQHSSQDFSAGPANYLSAMEFAPTDSQRAYAVDDAGGLYSSTDHALTWTKSADSAPDNHYFYGNALCVHPSDPLEAVVGGSGYSAVGVRRTRDGGVTWKDMADGLPPTLVYDLTYSEDGRFVYAATEAGPYCWERGVRVWQPIAQVGTPLTLYWSVETVPGRGSIRFGTYGRGVWDYHPEPSDEFWFSLKADAVLDGVAYEDGDLIGWDEDLGCLRMVLDSSDVLTHNVDIDACAVLDDGSILLSFGADESIDNLVGGPNGNLVDDEDLVRFVPVTLGDATSGSFEFYFDGSDLGLTTAAMDVDGVSVTPSGDLLLSFRGAFDLGGGLTGKDEDVVAFTPTQLGADTQGSFTTFLYGRDADVRLGGTGEDVDALSFDGANSRLYLSTVADFRVPVNLHGEDNDVLEFTGTAFGTDPAGSFVVRYDGAPILGAEDLDALHVFRR